MSRRYSGKCGFTLVELLVVIVIIVLISAVALPIVISAMSHRQTSEAARLVQATISGARDRSAQTGDTAAIRLLPDPAFPISYLSSGQIDLTQPIAHNRIIPLAYGDTYSEGLISSIVGIPNQIAILPYIGQGTQAIPNPVYGNTSALVVYESLVSVDSSGNILVNAPTSWFWNVRLGEKIQINNSGIWYTIIGPMVYGPAQGNSEMYVNVGPPNSKSVLSQSLPNGGTGYPEFLILVDGLDDNKNGYVDEGWDGIDNDNMNGIDDIGEWVEIEKMTQSYFNSQYTIKRIAHPTSNQGSIDLPSGITIDASRSVFSVNKYTGYVDILINKNGTINFQTIYSSPTSSSIQSSFIHLWLAERADIGVQSPQGQWALTTIFARTGRVNSLINPDISQAYSIAQQGSQ